MRYRHVCVAAVAHRVPEEVVTSDEIEDRLAPLYERLKLPAGRLELMTGIRERRFFPRGTSPGNISAQTATEAVDRSGIPRKYFGALIHGSVCRDQLEPATANVVHQFVGLPADALVLDVSNACLGLLDGMVMVADMIELGRIRAGVVVGTETGRDLVEHTIESLLSDPDVTRQSIKNDFASLTIGSGSAAVVLCDARLSRGKNQLLGGAFRCNTTHADLCAGGDAGHSSAESRPRMQTDSEALLHAGVELATETWEIAKRELRWTNDDVNSVFTHQVGRAHRKLMLERLELAEDLDFPTVETLGNTGAVALPMALSLGIEAGRLSADSNVALLGIGSGLNCLMLGMNWNGRL